MEVTPLHHVKSREQIAKAATKEIKRIGLPPISLLNIQIFEPLSVAPSLESWHRSFRG